MRKLILMTAIAIPLLALIVYAEQSYESSGESYGYAYGGDESGTSSYLGVDIDEVTTERMAALKLKEERGVEVTMVDQDAPAGKAGIKEHDVILSMNGTNVESGAQLRRLIRETPPGRVVTLNLSRDGQLVSLKVQLADRRKSMSAWGPKGKEFKFAMPNMPSIPDMDVPVSVVVVHSSMRSGLMVENITPQLGEFFGVKNGNGVLVRAVEKGSRAEKAGLRAGDLVVRVNDQTVHDTSDFTRALRSRGGNEVTLGIMRDKKEQSVKMTLPERKESGALIDEESLEIPDVDVEVQAKLADVQKEVARIQPQIDLAINEAKRAADEGKCQIEREMKKRQHDLEEQQELIKEREELIKEEQQEMLDQQRDLQEDIEIKIDGRLPI